ncbi:elongator complex protein 5 [Cherax quadricarinatus]|uniref:elongator complex protein 5 n=1 Tax=Cherax quadricarinatus TaxID=27406 RepID=UPI00387EAE74
MSKTNLEKIFVCEETPTPRILLLTDTNEVNGRGLLYTVINSHLRSPANIHYLHTSLRAQDIRRFLKEESSGKIEFYDGASDPCGWVSDQPEVSLQQPLQEIFRLGHNGDGSGKRKIVMVVDRLEDITHHQDSLHLIRSLHLLAAGDNVEQLILYCGRDVMPESVLSALCHISSAVVHVLPSSPCSCQLILKKPSRKIIKAHEEFSLNENLHLQDIQQSKSKEVPCSDENLDSVAILASQTTFNLTLTDDQRIAKNNLLLPHTRVQSHGDTLLHTGMG